MMNDYEINSVFVSSSIQLSHDTILAHKTALFAHWVGILLNTKYTAPVIRIFNYRRRYALFSLLVQWGFKPALLFMPSRTFHLEFLNWSIVSLNKSDDNFKGKS